MVESAAIGFRAGTVNHSVDAERLFLLSAAFAIGNGNAVGILVIRENPAGMGTKFLANELVRDEARDFGGDAVAMDLPVGAGMAQEAALFDQRQRLPDLGGKGT